MRQLLLLISLVSTTAFAGRPFFCIGGATFVSSELAHRVSASCTIRATFDVHNLAVTNVKLVQLNASLGELLISETRENLNRITFLCDTSGASLSFHYEYLPTGLASNDYVRKLTDSTVQVVFRAPGIMHKGTGHRFGTLPPQTGDTIWYSSTIIGTPSNGQPSRITVERVFSGGRDSVIIIENNHPEFTNEILRVAAGYGLDLFLHLQHPDLSAGAISQQEFPNAYKKTYVIRFRILWKIPSCNTEVWL